MPSDDDLRSEEQAEENSDSRAAQYAARLSGALPTDLNDVPSVGWEDVEQEAHRAALFNTGILTPRVRISPFAMADVDHWTRIFGQRMSVACSTGEPLDFKNIENMEGWKEFVAERSGVSTDFNVEESLADFFALMFSRSPELRPQESCSSPLRWQFMNFAINEVRDQQILQARTAGDIFASTLATEALWEQWKAFLVAYMQDEKVQRAAAKALGNIQTEPSMTCSGFGTHRGTLKPATAEEIDEILKLMRDVRRDPRLSKIMRLAGRYWRQAVDIQRNKVEHRMSDDQIVDTGADLRSALPAELARLTHPLLKLQLLGRVASRSVLIRTAADHKVQVRGPIIVAVDESGSMNASSHRTKNTRREEAKAISVALANLAHLQNRWFGMLSWACQGQTRFWTIPPRAPHYTKSLIEYASHFFNGGTYLPLPQITQIIEELCGGGIRPDVVLITDGDVPLIQNETAAFIEWRKRREVKIFGLALACASPLLEQISTNYYPVPDLDFGEEAVKSVLGI